MAASEHASEFHLGEEREFMLGDLALLLFCLIVALCSLGIVAWEAAYGRILSMDGLALSLICLTLAVVFGGNVVWSVHNGDVRRILSHIRKSSAENEEREKHPPG